MDAARRTTTAAIAGTVISIVILMASSCSQLKLAQPPKPVAHAAEIGQTFPTSSTTESTSTTTTVAAVVAQATPTTVTPSVEPAVTAAAAPDGCWIDLARQVGWPEDTLGHLVRIINRESHCDPTAFADRPSTLDNSRGLLQINAYGNLADHIRRVCGVEPDALFDPQTNLACGLVYYQRSGWQPWGG
jgi:hypothetical protein